MKLYPLIADLWKMDGGVAFGVVPKSIWNKNGMADENNLIPIVTRCLLVKQDEKLILIDAGMGNKRDERYYQVRHRDPEVTLEKALYEAGFEADQITDVLFTHLHDDHVGGATSKDSAGNPVLVFPNATYYCSRNQWEWANNPNKREAASYFPDNLLPLINSNRLRFIEKDGELFPGIQVRIYNGHTMGQVIPFIMYLGKTVVFTGDFIPTAFNIRLPYVPAVDIQPLVSMDEKGQFLKEAVQGNYHLVFEHDYYQECCTLKQTEKLITTDSCMTLESLAVNE